MIQNLYKNVELAVGLNAGTINSDTTTTGTAIDAAGYEQALVVPFVTTRSAGTVTPAVNESDASGSGFAAVDSAQLSGTLAGAAVATANTFSQGVGVRLRKRYLRADLVSTGSANLVAGVLVILSHPRSAPVA